MRACSAVAWSVENGRDGVLASTGIRLHDKPKIRDKTIANGDEKVFKAVRPLTVSAVISALNSLVKLIASRSTRTERAEAA